jgi:hypothetical protein
MAVGQGRTKTIYPTLKNSDRVSIKLSYPNSRPFRVNNIKIDEVDKIFEGEDLDNTKCALRTFSALRVGNLVESEYLWDNDSVKITISVPN